MKHAATKNFTAWGDYSGVDYRNYTIDLSERVSTGYFGRYTIGSHIAFTTLKEAKDWVDAQIEDKS